MAVEERVKHLPKTREKIELLGEEGGDLGLMQKLESYSSLLKKCTEIVHGKTLTCKFNKRQCEYLAEKLKSVVQKASSFLDVLQSIHHVKPTTSEDFEKRVILLAKRHFKPCTYEYVEKWAEIFKLLLSLAYQVDSFVQSCCKVEWIQAAMTLSNMSEYVSSLVFNVEFYSSAFNKEHAALTKELAAFSKELGALSKKRATLSEEEDVALSEEELAALFAEFSTIRVPTLVELDTINRTEVEIVKVRASEDLRTLREEVEMQLPSLRGEAGKLATFLLQRLSGDEPTATSDNGGFLHSLFNLMKPGEKQLGKGASGAVFKSTWLGMPVAKKVFEGQENSDFLREVEILSPLSHPNVMTMFCCAKTERSCSIIMELMDGDLHASMRRHNPPPFPILESVEIMLQIGEGVNYLHSKGIIHRDLKSGNILVKRKESGSGHIHVKVADFGLSKTKDCSMRFSKLPENTGTYRWMPPEVINLRPQGVQEWPSKDDNQPRYPFKCDTYSFGMVCYEILTGYLPFDKEKLYTTSRIIKEKIIEGERPRLPDDCPLMVKALIERCWSQVPKKRPRFSLICSQLRFTKYLLMTGASLEAHSIAIKEFEAAADEAYNKEEEREQALAASKLQAEAARFVEAQQAHQIALSPLEVGARDAQARELESALKAAATKSKEKAALVAHRQGLQPFEWPTCKQVQAAMSGIRYEPGKFHVAVCGVAGSGKSSLINAFRGLRWPQDESAACVGATETTLEVARYPDPRSELPYSKFVWYDIPGAGTAMLADGQYFKTQGLFVFDWIIMVYGERFSMVEFDIVENCLRFHIPMFIVRSKADQHIDNMIRSETDFLPGDDEYNQIFRETRARYIGATKSDFDMHKEVMGEVLFEVYQQRPHNLHDDPIELKTIQSVEGEIARTKLLSNRVFMVSARNVCSLMQTGVKQGRGVDNRKTIDEAVLVEDMLRAKIAQTQFNLVLPAAYWSGLGHAGVNLNWPKLESSTRELFAPSLLFREAETTSCQTSAAAVRLWEFEDDSLRSVIQLGSYVSRGLWGNCVFARKEFDFKDEFDREIAVAMNVSHPNIVHYFGYSLWANNAESRVVYMELLDGNLEMSLREAHQKRIQLLSFRSLLGVLLQIAEAVRHLHERNFVHGNLKPSTILVSRQQHSEAQLDLVKVAGFSCAQRVDSKSGESVKRYQCRIRALNYTAPEVLKCWRYSGRHGLRGCRHFEKIDVYSFGVVAYQLITEVPEVYEPGFHAVRAGVKDGTLRPDHNLLLLRALDEDRSSLLPLVRACWDQNPDNRPTFEQICATLRNLRS